MDTNLEFLLRVGMMAKERWPEIRPQNAHFYRMIKWMPTLTLPYLKEPFLPMKTRSPGEDPLFLSEEVTLEKIRDMDGRRICIGYSSRANVVVYYLEDGDDSSKGPLSDIAIRRRN